MLNPNLFTLVYGFNQETGKTKETIMKYGYQQALERLTTLLNYSYIYARDLLQTAEELASTSNAAISKDNVSIKYDTGTDTFTISL